jgi:hypothetical protein
MRDGLADHSGSLSFLYQAEEVKNLGPTPAETVKAGLQIRRLARVHILRQVREFVKSRSE